MTRHSTENTVNVLNHMTYRPHVLCPACWTTFVQYGELKCSRTHLLCAAIVLWNIFSFHVVLVVQWETVKEYSLHSQLPVFFCPNSSMQWLDLRVKNDYRRYIFVFWCTWQNTTYYRGYFQRQLMMVLVIGGICELHCCNGSGAIIYVRSSIMTGLGI